MGNQPIRVRPAPHDSPFDIPALQDREPGVDLIGRRELGAAQRMDRAHAWRDAIFMAAVALAILGLVVALVRL